ncbi:flagellar biosynthetic protein FliQ [Henriciella marina]|uniref:flagellar biosynthetic protein FliQ n=1 Tax=Henriciella marina TaxID=453851 RepID=UPI000371EB89|nr:flagellar biosynthetic protein FliQ [Henriciella marina]
MTELAIFEILRGAFWTATLMAMPILAITLILGFAIGLLQALTSIQEMTLTFVPKIMAVVVVFFLTLGYMTQLCLDFFNNSVLPMISG